MINEKQPTVFTFLGVPGSGKSYFARNLAKETGTIRLSSDAMRLAIFGSREAIAKVYHSDEKENVNRYVHRAFDYVFDEILSHGHDIICDAHYNNRPDRDHLREEVSKFGASVVLLRINTPYELALQRGQEREETNDQRQLSEAHMREVMDRHKANTDEPGSDELVIDIDGTELFVQQYISFQNQLQEISR